MSEDRVTMSIFRTIWDEQRAARAAMREIVHIRVTPDAIPGSVTTTPLTPERARALKPLIYHHPSRDTPDAVADPDMERALELLVHPKDWAELRMDVHAKHALQVGASSGGVDRVMGIPVTNR